MLTSGYKASFSAHVSPLKHSMVQVVALHAWRYDGCCVHHVQRLFAWLPAVWLMSLPCLQASPRRRRMRASVQRTSCTRRWATQTMRGTPARLRLMDLRSLRCTSLCPCWSASAVPAPCLCSSSVCRGWKRYRCLQGLLKVSSIHASPAPGPIPDLPLSCLDSRKQGRHTGQLSTGSISACLLSCQAILSMRDDAVQWHSCLVSV